MSVGTLWDPTNHYLISGQLNPQHILVERLFTAGYQAYQVHFLPPLDGWPNQGHQLDDHAHPTHVQVQAPPHLG
jgi:hypothetical protein